VLNKTRKFKMILCVSCLSVLQACANTTVVHPDPDDPWEKSNRAVMAFNDEFDKYILKPTAKDYQWIIPISINTHINMAHFLAHNDWILLGHVTNLFPASQQASTICSCRYAQS
jgi:ABC-type transporter lipoprotein component MlaA